MSGYLQHKWEFVWSVEKPLTGSPRQSKPFSWRGHMVYLTFCYENKRKHYSVVLHAPPSFAESANDICVRVASKNKTPLPRLDVYGYEPNSFLWRRTEKQILKAYPNFNVDGGILTFIVMDVDLPEDCPRFDINDVPSLEALSADLSLLLEDHQDFRDVELCGKEHTTRVHRNIICSRSKVISAALESGMSEARTGRISMKEMECEVLDRFVRYLYTGKLSEPNMETVKGLYEVADKYDVASLMKRCVSFLLEKLTSDNACEMLLLADAHNDQNFREMVIDFMVKNEVPLKDEHWLVFYKNYPALSNEVLYRFCKRLSN